MTLKGGSEYWLMVDGFRIKPVRFLVGKLTEPQIRNVIDEECKKLCISRAGVDIRLLKAQTKWDHKVNYL